MRLISLDSPTGLESNRLVMYRYRLYSIPSSLEETREISRRVEVQESRGEMGGTDRDSSGFIHYLGTGVVGLLGWVR